jgi:nucleoside phosphorylase
MSETLARPTAPGARGAPPVDGLELRVEIARTLIEQGTEPFDLEQQPVAVPLLAADLGIPFPAERHPVPLPIDPPPDPGDPLPLADVVVVTWTIAELNALADVLTPGHPRSEWYRYDRGFADHYRPRIRAGAPALKARRLGSYFLTRVGNQTVLCLKSELHLNQDGIATGDGTATLPVRDFFRQVIDEAKPAVVLTVGTSGGVALEQSLGDAVVTRGARFRCQSEFANEPWNGRTFTSEWEIPTTWFGVAEELMQPYGRELVEPGFAPPTKRYAFDAGLLQSDPPNDPRIRLDGRDLPPFHPVLTTDFFEFGTSANALDREGCAVEMGDAVLGLVCDEMDDPPRWAIVRNISDPMINGDLPTEPASVNMQTHWAVWYYEVYGYWTSVTGALATWAIVAGLDPGAPGRPDGRHG